MKSEFSFNNADIKYNREQESLRLKFRFHYLHLILVDPSLDIITIYSVCMIQAWGVEKKCFIEIMHFYYMTCMTTPQHRKFTNFTLFISNLSRLQLGVMKFTVSRLHILQTIHNKKFGPAVFEKVLTHGERHTTDENQQKQVTQVT